MYLRMPQVDFWKTSLFITSRWVCGAILTIGTLANTTFAQTNDGWRTPGTGVVTNGAAPTGYGAYSYNQPSAVQPNSNILPNLFTQPYTGNRSGSYQPYSYNQSNGTSTNAPLTPVGPVANPPANNVNPAITPMGSNIQPAANWNGNAWGTPQANGAPAATVAQNPNMTNVSNAEQPIHARVTNGSGTLPSDAGQVWRDYDISPYTTRITSTNRPEQSIVDWILRETGYEAWHGEPFAILSANKSTLRVYHTPAMHTIVADIVDRFVNSQASTHTFGLRIVTIKNPNWRAKAMRLMRPIPVQSPGVQGWLLAKEDAALLIAELQRRTDYREHHSPNLQIHNGQTSLISTMRQRTYIRGITPTATAWPGYQPDPGVLDEGFSLEFSPLISLDNRSVDAVVKLRLNQVEKMLPVKLDVPSQAAPSQQVDIEVPQFTMCHLHERFRWPVDSVLLLSMGVVATPEQESENLFTSALPLPKNAPRADALLFLESKGRVPQVEAAAATARRDGPSYYGRY